MTLEVMPGVPAGARFQHQAEVTYHGFQATDPAGFGTEIEKDGNVSLLHVPDRWFQKAFQLDEGTGVRIAKQHPSARATRDLKISGPVLLTVYNLNGAGGKSNYWVTAPRAQTLEEFAVEFSKTLGSSRDWANVTSHISTTFTKADGSYLLQGVGNLVTVDVPTEISPLS